MDRASGLEGSMFSSELLGKVYTQFIDRYRNGLSLSPGTLTDLSQEEMAHIVGVLQKRGDTVNEKAFDDCVRTICREAQSSSDSSEDALMAMRKNMMKRKGYKT